MKTKNILFNLVFIIWVIPLFAQKKEAKVWVNGACGMCKSRIENTAKENGASIAKWDLETKTLSLKWNEKTIQLDSILQKIAEIGHDNEKYKTSESTYNNLPECCWYDRNDESQKKILENAESPNEVVKINTIEILKTQDAISLNKKSAPLTFDIGKKELLKAACCNLSESFETNATVDVSINNAVTGSKQLKMLGLDQKYTLLTKELLPEIRGLASAYGLQFIPGKWISGIQLTKGGSSVVNGYESITGQINTELVKWDKKAETTLNFFGDLNTRLETNITNTNSLNENWAQSILLHANRTVMEMDENKDGFMDQPNGNQLNANYILQYNNPNLGWMSQTGLHVLKDNRNSGQTKHHKDLIPKNEKPYIVEIETDRLQLWNKTGFVFAEKPYQSIGWTNQFTLHNQNSIFGERNYSGEQNSFHSNLIFESIIGSTNHRYKTGASFLYDQYHEVYQQTHFKRTEHVPGIFVEYTYTGDKLSIVSGARIDFHNLAGTQFTPRMNIKYDLFPKTILRLSAGKGFRTANIFAENQSFFVSNRQIEIQNNGGEIYGLQPEIAWNYGLSIQQEFSLFNRKSSLVADFFRTDFTQQVVVDLDQSPQKIFFYNLHGKSWANSFQTQWDFTPFHNLNWRLAYKYYDVKTDYTDSRRTVPLVPKHRGFVNWEYTTHKKENGSYWSIDTTLNWVGKQRLPNTTTNPIAYQRGSFGKSFYTINAQVAKNFSEKIRGYIGVENISGTMQENAIIDSQNPYGNYFDASLVYAPIMKPNIYLGVDVSF